MEIKQYEYNSVLFNIDFRNKINLLVDNSGTGKTFLLKMLKFYCDEHDIPCVHVDYMHRDMPLENARVLLFDKADLYFSNELFERLKALDAVSVISIKNTSELDLFGDIGFYRLKNSGLLIETEKWG
jgi:hypothetical protein